MDALGVDVVPLRTSMTRLGFRNEGWKSWTTFAGTPVLVPERFNTEPEPNGAILQFPCGDKIHNVQANIPKENLLALYEAISEYGRFPVG